MISSAMLPALVPLFVAFMLHQRLIKRRGPKDVSRGGDRFVLQVAAWMFALIGVLYAYGGYKQGAE